MRLSNKMQTEFSRKHSIRRSVIFALILWKSIKSKHMADSHSRSTTFIQTYVYLCASNYVGIWRFFLRLQFMEIRRAPIREWLFVTYCENVALNECYQFVFAILYFAGIICYHIFLHVFVTFLHICIVSGTVLILYPISVLCSNTLEFIVIYTQKRMNISRFTVFNDLVYSMKFIIAIPLFYYVFRG